MKPRSPEHASSELVIEGKKLSVSRLEKVLYPRAGFTKGQVIDYYIRIAPFLLPHLKDRALTMKRYPNGVEQPFFYEKRCPPYRPAWVKTANIWSESNAGEIPYCLANNLPSLIWAANLADLELHTSLARASNPDRPTMMVFDLDPGPPANIIHCCRVAILLRDELEKISLKSFAKTSGSKGLQIYAPLNTPVSYDQTKSSARALAEQLSAEHPKEILYRMEKKAREGKVFIDWSQNDRHKTTVCAYSLRAKEQPTVSTPVSWKEVEAAARARDPKCLSFTSDEVLQRVKKLGDLFEPVLKLKQKLPK